MHEPRIADALLTQIAGICSSAALFAFITLRSALANWARMAERPTGSASRPWSVPSANWLSAATDHLAMEKNMRTYLTALSGGVISSLMVGSITIALTTTAAAAPKFTVTPLELTKGSSEPEISIGAGGTMAMVSLQWLFDPNSFGTQLWTGPFGSTPTLQGIVDASLQHPGKSVFGAGDADVDLGSTGRLHVTTLIFLLNPPFRNSQFGVSAISCPSPTNATFSISQCSPEIIDTTTDDRPWITSDGAHVYVSYHDSQDGSLIHVQRSDDDGFTWKRVGDPIVGQARLTADSTFNNIQGKLVADPHSHNVYDIYAAGETGFLKGRTFTPNHILVSRSTDMGETWTANVAFETAPGTSLANIFPALAVDPTNGNLYAVWSDGHNVSFASSTDQGNHWSPAVRVSSAPANTAIFPWVAAYNGTVDVTYYGTTAASNLDPNAQWHVYFAQLNAGSFTQTQVNSGSIHGVISNVV
jgi:hypothetical protein